MSYGLTTFGGLGRVERTETASAMIGRKEYRYLSPSILVHSKTRQIVKLNSAGLVHNPNLFLTTLASQENTMLPPNKAQQPDVVNLAAQIAKLVGLPPETPVDQLLAKLAELVKGAPDPAKFMSVAAVQEMLRERRSELSLQRQERVTFKVQ